jgi:hypothetical protein
MAISTSIRVKPLLRVKVTRESFIPQGCIREALLLCVKVKNDGLLMIILLLIDPVPAAPARGD